MPPNLLVPNSKSQSGDHNLIQLIAGILCDSKRPRHEIRHLLSTIPRRTINEPKITKLMYKIDQDRKLRAQLKSR